MTWLLTGGAGYIGAHVASALSAAGISTVVLDDLSTGFAERLPPGVPLVEADVADRARVVAALRGHGVDGVVHLAAKKSVPESMAHPMLYWESNVGGFLGLLGAMAEAGVDRIVYSSSAAVIGTPDGEIVDEDTPPRPENPYGSTKLACEWMLADVARAGRMRAVSLRYFNVAGAGAPTLGDRGATNLIPLVFRALTHGQAPQVFGDDYATRDGSCVRDYIHVADLARAHVDAVRHLTDAPAGEVRTYNVGRGEGVTVKEVMAAVREATGIDFAYEVSGRRAGDPARVVGAVGRIAAELGWTAELDLDDMVTSAWKAWQSLPA